MEEHDLMNNVFLIPYKSPDGFNPAMALNIGTRNARSKNIIISSPEVKPNADVLEKLSECEGQNIICKVHDEAEDGTISMVLVYQGFRDSTPAMYFLALFNKDDIEKINGWDEDFMRGYAYEDDDFGARWVRAGLPFTLREDIEAVHQYHPRTETIEGGLTTNLAKFTENTNNEVVKCVNGLYKL
jgi:hypothetical protein